MPAVGYARLIQKCLHQQPKMCFEHNVRWVHQTSKRFHVVKFDTIHQQPATACDQSSLDPHRQIEQPNDSDFHTPVFVKEVVDLINPQPGQVVLDMTFGAGGHTKALLQRCKDITVFAVDRDPVAHRFAQQLSLSHSQVKPLAGRFTDVLQLLRCENVMAKVDAVLFDVGTSSMQLEIAERGFGLSRDGPLDMRMDQSRFVVNTHEFPNFRSPQRRSSRILRKLSEHQPCPSSAKRRAEQKAGQLTAEDVVNNLDEDDLFTIIKKYGEEKRARQIARAIVDSRYSFGRIVTTKQLAAIVASVFDRSHTVREKFDRPVHVATKTFQALRIFINDELNQLYNGLNAAHALLRPGGICVAVTFHSLEDRIVKRSFLGQDMDERTNMSVTDRYRNPTVLHSVDDLSVLLAKRWQPVFKNVVLPSETEVAENPRSRSAKLRAAWKLESETADAGCRLHSHV